MSIEIVQSLPKEAWREFVDGNPAGNIFHTPEMFEVFSKTRRYQPTLWAAVNSHAPLALLLPVQIRLFNGLLRRLTTRSVAYGSILCEPSSEGKKALIELLETYRHETRKSVLFTELRNVHDMTDVQSTLEEHGFVYEDHLNYLIDLTQPTEQLWKNIRSNAQRNIRKAEKSGVTVAEAQTIEDVRAAYAILRNVYERIRVPIPDISLFESAYEILHPGGMMDILFAKLKGVTIGAQTHLLYKGEILYWYTGALREYAKYRPGDLLVWSALEFGKKRRCYNFDFGGGGKPDEEYGVRDFKLKFGGKQVNFGRNICVHAPLRLKLSKLGYRLLRGVIS